MISTTPRKLLRGGDTSLREASLALADELSKGRNSLLISMNGPAGKMVMELRLYDPDLFSSETGESDAWARLRAVQKRLVDAGVRDVKFHFAIGPETPASQVASDAADLLEAHLPNAAPQERGAPLSEHTDAVTEPYQAEPAVAARDGQFDKQETPRTDALELALYQADSCLVTEPTFPEMMDFTRQLERELAEAHREIQRICQKQADADNEREQTVSATLPHDLIYKLHGWTGQLAEQPPSRIAPGIAQAAKRLHDELQLYVKVSDG